jgi:hypothetical protein
LSVLRLKKPKAILGSALIALIALGFSFYVLQLLYLGFLLIKAGRADTEPFEAAGFRHVALGISVAVSGVAFGLFYRKQSSRRPGSAALR